MSEEVPPGGFGYFGVSANFPADQSMYALTNNGDVYFSPSGGGQWVQTVFGTPGTQNPTVVYGSAPVYLAPDFVTSQLAVLSTPAGLYSITSTQTESKLQYGDTLDLNATNITPPPSGSSYPGAAALGFAFGPGDVMYASSGAGLYKSGDEGGDWTILYVAPSGVESIALSPDFATDQTMALATPAGVFISTDGGKHFKQTSIPAAASGTYVVRFSSSYAQDGTIAVIVPDAGVYLSGDKGGTWTKVFDHRGAISLALTGNVIYVGTDSAAGQAKGLYASLL